MLWRNQKKSGFLGLFVIISAVWLLAPMQSFAKAIARGYLTDDQGVQNGMVVSISIGSDSDSKVERTTYDNTDRVVGVVTTLENSLVAVGSGSASVLVENEGQVSAYVSDINGEVKEGDHLVISPLKGVLMRSDGINSTVIGIAASSPESPEKYNYSKNGEAAETLVGLTKVNLVNQGSDKAKSSDDSVFAELGKSLVGKDVSEARVLFALIIFVLVLIAEGGIIYGAISSSITSLGRNPLARNFIRSELFRVAGIAVMVLMVGLGAVYVILWI